MPRLEKKDRLKLPHVPIPKRPPQERIADFCAVSLTCLRRQLEEVIGLDEE